MTEQRAGKPVAFAWHRITLDEGADADAFQRFMLEDVFPATNTAGEHEDPDQHFLTTDRTSAALDGPRAYIWLSKLDYQIHQTPLPTWLSNRVEELHEAVRDRLAPFGTAAAAEVYYDVAAWRRRLGT